MGANKHMVTAGKELTNRLDLRFRNLHFVDAWRVAGRFSLFLDLEVGR